MKKKIKFIMGPGLAISLAALSLIIMVSIHQTVKDLPSVSSLEQYVPPLVTNVLDAYGQPIGQFFTERRTNVPLNQIPLDLVRAVIATEDLDFHEHWGIDPTGIMRAMISNIRAGRVVEGGSTLTQQLAKTVFLTRQKTFTRKFRELLLTLQIEYKYSKDEIMELYLNQMYFGSGAYGVEAAAKLYFDKHADEMTLPECALLAGLPRSPNRYSPLRNPDLAQQRRAHVLRRMRVAGFITEAEEEEANAAEIVPETAGHQVRQAHYFLEEIKKQLAPKYGEETLEQGGLTIHTTLDLKMQEAAEKAIQEHVENYELLYSTDTLAEYNEDMIEKARRIDPEIKVGPLDEPQVLFEGTTYQITLSTIPPPIQAALVALDVHTGAIRAMVGGRDFFNSQFNRAVQARRQPGSAFKPFVWAAALQDRFTAATVINDYPLVYIDIESDPTLLAETTSYAQTWDAIYDHLQMTAADLKEMKEEEQEELLKQFWRPQNYDHRYLGPMTLRRGLQRSRNLISVRIIDSIGPRKVVALAREAGLDIPLPPVLSLALGTAVLSPLQIANAFATFASGGFHSEPYYYERVLDRRGKVMEVNTPRVASTMKPQTAFLITNLLKGVVERGTGWYARRLRRPLGGKTGTTQDQRDVWFVGFSPDVAAAVWMGYDDFRPLKKGKSASSLAVPLWTDFMRGALQGNPKKDFPIPPNIEFAKIDVDTGYLALPSCPNVVLEAFRVGTVPTEFCPFEHELKDQPEEEINE